MQIPLSIYRENLRRLLDSYIRNQIAKGGKYMVEKRPLVHNSYPFTDEEDADTDIEMQNDGRQPLMKGYASSKGRLSSLYGSDYSTFSQKLFDSDASKGSTRYHGWKPKSRYSGYGSA